jgi:hypothetical protein
MGDLVGWAMDEAAGRARTGPESTPTERARERARDWVARYAQDRTGLWAEPAAELVARVGRSTLHWSDRVMALGVLLHADPAPAELAPVLRSVVRNDADPDYVRLDAAMALALLGQRDEAAVEVLRRVVTPGTCFAMSQSNMELGAACIGLALLGDSGSRPRILAALRTSFNGIDRDAALALQVLDRAP